MNKHLTTIFALLLAALCLTVGAVGLATADPGVGNDPPRGETIVDVRGTANDGFTIRRYNRTIEHTPTKSEAVAECSEYDMRVQRVRCRAEVRTRYSDLGDLKRSISFQKSRH